MNPETKNMWKAMRDFSFNVLGRAIYDCTFNEIDKPSAHTLSIMSAAHGAELLIKSRIVMEHPLLIFDKLPKSPQEDSYIYINMLVENGTTNNYSKLPDLLWATTGYKMPQEKKTNFINFGKLRNRVIHLGIGS